MSDPPSEYPISELRAHLPAVFDQVLDGPGQVVRVTRRGTDERAVLVSESSYEALLERIRGLQRQLRHALQVRERRAEFRLAGSAELMVAADEVFSETRAEQAALIARKHRRL